MSNTPIQPGQVWRTYMGAEVRIERRLGDDKWLAIDVAGNTRTYNDRGQSDPTAFLAVDLESLMAEAPAIFPHISKLDADGSRVGLRKSDPEKVQTGISIKLSPAESEHLAEFFQSLESDAGDPLTVATVDLQLDGAKITIPEDALTTKETVGAESNPDQQLFTSMDEVYAHITKHGTRPNKVFYIVEPMSPSEAGDTHPNIKVTFADAVDDTVDADSLASETLQALGWVFDGQCWVQPSPMPSSDDIAAHPLYPIYMAAIEQAMFGKGERHGGARTPFLDQPWVHYVKMHGRGFATGQAAKKLEEAASTREGKAFETEVLGAIVYSGMAILKERGAV